MDIFTFFQKDLQSTSFAAFEEMKRKGQFCDLTIKVQNRSITAHKVVVAAGIPYFQTAFDGTDPAREEKEIAVQDNLDAKALESLILFAYTSKVDITCDNVQCLLATAQFLELYQIRDACIEFLSKRININNVVQVRELAVRLNLSQMTDGCNRYIRKSFEDFSKTDDFLGLSHLCVKEILSEDDLVVSSEEVVFEAMMNWVKFSPSDRHVVLPELLTEVRMIFLPIPYFIKQVDTNELISNSKLCKDLIKEVRYYHMLPEIFEELPNLKTRPRNCLMQSLYAVCSYDGPDGHRLLIFTLVNNKWLVLSSFAPLCCVCHVVAVDGKIYMFLDKNIVTFDPENQKWNHLNASGESIDGAAAVVHEGKIYCFGSESDDFMNKMQFFDTQMNKWSETKEMNRKRWDPAAALLGEFIYVTGGHDGETRTNSVEKYSPSADKWIDVEPMLVGRDRHGCTSINGKIYVCGGMYSDDTILSVAEVYDPHGDQWNYVSSMENSKIVISVISHCGKIYAFGPTDVEVYEPVNNEWESCTFVPKKLHGVVSISTTTIPNKSSEVTSQK